MAIKLFICSLKKPLDYVSQDPSHTCMRTSPRMLKTGACALNESTLYPTLSHILKKL